MGVAPPAHDATHVIEPSHEQPAAPDRDSLLRIEVFGPSERVAPTQRLAEAAPETPFEPSPSELAPPEAAPLAPPPPSVPRLTPTETEMFRREADVIRRERALSGAEGLVDAGTADVERRERKLAQMESTIHERMRELEEREERVERREIELEGAFTLREDRIEARAAELVELDERLSRKEEDLARYVGQLQAQLVQRG